jgi:hypothetical protein
MPKRVANDVIFIDASHMPAASEADLAQLEAILDSMVIDRGF